MKRIQSLTQSIFFKTFLRLSCIMLALVLLIHGLIYFLYTQQNLNKEAEHIESQIAYLDELSETLALPDFLKSVESFALTSNANISIKIGEKIYRYGSDDLILFDHLGENENIDVKGDAFIDSVLIRANQVSENANQISIQVAKTLRQIAEARNLTFSFMPYTLLTAIIVSLLASYFYSKSITKSIIQIEQTLEKMLSLSESVKIDVDRNDEIGRLSDSINQLYFSLLQNINDYKESNVFILYSEQQKLNFLRTTSHELKTPVAKLSILLENMMLNVGKYQDRDTYLAEAFQVNQELSYMTKELLSGLKGNSLEQRSLNNVNVRNYLEEMISYYELFFKSKNLHVLLSSENFHTKIDAADLRFLLSNVFSNLAKYSKAESSIQITLQDGTLTLISTPAKDSTQSLVSIESKLYNSSRSQQSNGFGINIIKQICDDYGIELDYEVRDELLVMTIDFNN